MEIRTIELKNIIMRVNSDIPQGFSPILEVALLFLSILILSLGGLLVFYSYFFPLRRTPPQLISGISHQSRIEVRYVRGPGLCRLLRFALCSSWMIRCHCLALLCSGLSRNTLLYLFFSLSIFRYSSPQLMCSTRTLLSCWVLSLMSHAWGFCGVFVGTIIFLVWWLTEVFC